MPRSHEADIARLYHMHSSNQAARPLETTLDTDDKPLRFRSYPGSPRTPLPGRDFALSMSLGQALATRRSVRVFGLRPLPLETLGRLLHASYGIRARRRLEGEVLLERAAPSAGALYPIEVYVAVQLVEGLANGLYHYDPVTHELEERKRGTFHESLVRLTMGQGMVAHANVVVLYAMMRARTMFKYGQRGYRYLLFDTGHAAQNLYLVATALGLAPVTMGSFLDDEVNILFGLPEGEEALYLACVGQRLSGETGEGG